MYNRAINLQKHDKGKLPERVGRKVMGLRP